MNLQDLNRMTLKELKDLARSHEISTSNRNKAELIRKIDYNLNIQPQAMKQMRERI